MRKHLITSLLIALAATNLSSAGPLDKGTDLVGGTVSFSHRWGNYYASTELNLSPKWHLMLGNGFAGGLKLNFNVEPTSGDYYDFGASIGPSAGYFHAIKQDNVIPFILFAHTFDFVQYAWHFSSHDQYGLIEEGIHVVKSQGWTFTVSGGVMVTVSDHLAVSAELSRIHSERDEHISEEVLLEVGIIGMIY